MISNKQKALIHVARASIGMSEDEYRAMLSGFGVSSSTALDGRKFEDVMRHFQNLGFQPRPKPGKTRKTPAPIPDSRARLKYRIDATAEEMHLTRAYLDAISRRMFQVDSWQWLNAEQMRKLLAALIYHRKRQANTTEG